MSEICLMEKASSPLMSIDLGLTVQETVVYII